jgi:hypothetical protein
LPQGVWASAVPVETETVACHSVPAKRHPQVHPVGKRCHGPIGLWGTASCLVAFPALMVTLFLLFFFNIVYPDQSGKPVFEGIVSDVYVQMGVRMGEKFGFDSVGTVESSYIYTHVFRTGSDGEASVWAHSI